MRYDSFKPGLGIYATFGVVKGVCKFICTMPDEARVDNPISVKNMMLLFTYLEFLLTKMNITTKFAKLESTTPEKFERLFFKLEVHTLPHTLPDYSSCLV